MIIYVRKRTHETPFSRYAPFSQFMAKAIEMIKDGCVCSTQKHCLVQAVQGLSATQFRMLISVKSAFFQEVSASRI